MEKNQIAQISMYLHTFDFYVDPPNAICTENAKL
jgi:hypothetical protein